MYIFILILTVYICKALTSASVVRGNYVARKKAESVSNVEVCTNNIVVYPVT